MKKHVLFIQGGGNGGYEADIPLASSLQEALGKSYAVIYPQIYSNERAADFGWTEQIRHEISAVGDNCIIVAHSFGASLLLKYLSENKPEKKMLESSLSRRHSGKEMNHGKLALSCKKILQRGYLKEFQFISTIAVMMKRSRFFTSTFTDKNCPAQASVKYRKEAIN